MVFDLEVVDIDYSASEFGVLTTGNGTTYYVRPRTIYGSGSYDGEMYDGQSQWYDGYLYYTAHDAINFGDPAFEVNYYITQDFSKVVFYKDKEPVYIRDDVTYVMYNGVEYYLEWDDNYSEYRLYSSEDDSLFTSTTYDLHYSRTEYWAQMVDPWYEYNSDNGGNRASYLRFSGASDFNYDISGSFEISRYAINGEWYNVFTYYVPKGGHNSPLIMVDEDKYRRFNLDGFMDITGDSLSRTHKKYGLYQNAGLLGSRCDMLSGYYAMDLLRGSYTNKSTMEAGSGGSCYNLNRTVSDENVEPIMQYTYDELNKGNPVVL
jgi:hypothetical protein